MGNIMSSFIQRLASPAALLYIFIILTQIPQGFYSAGQIEPPPAFTLIFSAGLLWIVGWWLLTDSRKRDIPWIFDIGFFLSIAWPFVIPYYLLKTRGSKGLLFIFAFISTYVAALVVGIILYWLLAPSVR
jgi:hypothetical protein